MKAGPAKPKTKKTAAKSSAAKSKAVKPRAAKTATAKAAAKPAKPKTSKATSPKTTPIKIAKPKAAVSRTRKASASVVAKPASAGSPTLDLILARIDDMKAEQTITIDLRGKSAFSDFMVVTSGRSNRHVGAVAETIAKGLKERGIKGLHVEGLTNCDWVLIDTGEVIVHIFRPEVREFYNLERLWTQTPDALAKPA